jgi:hypothetical protein
VGTVQCTVHGTQKIPYVCGHILDGLRQRERVGFFTADAEPQSDAWCTACEERFTASGGWVGEAKQQLRLSVICGACYDLAKKFHTGSDPWA